MATLVSRYGFDLAAERGHRRDDIREGFRITGFERSATIAFAVEEKRVATLRVFRGGQDWERETDWLYAT